MQTDAAASSKHVRHRDAGPRGDPLSYRAPYVVIAEVVFESPDGEMSYCSGRFSAVRFGSDIGAVEQGPEAVLIDEAMAWAEQTGVVIVRVGVDGREFSAGSREPRGRALPRWPAGGMQDLRTRKSAWTT